MRAPGYYWVRYKGRSEACILLYDPNHYAGKFTGGGWVPGNGDRHHPTPDGYAQDTDFDYIANAPLVPPTMK